MKLARLAIGALGFLAISTVVADEAPHSSDPNTEARVCRDIQRYGSRIMERICGTQQQVTRAKQARELLLKSAEASELRPPPKLELQL